MNGSKEKVYQIEREGKHSKCTGIFASNHSFPNSPNVTNIYTYFYFGTAIDLVTVFPITKAAIK